MSKCTDYPYYTICSSEDLNGTNITISYQKKYENDVSQLLFDAELISSKPLGGVHEFLDDVDPLHPNSSFTRIKTLIANDLIFEIFKVIADKYKANQEVLQSDSNSKTIEEQKKDVVKDISKLVLIKTELSVDGGGFRDLFGLCRNKGSVNVNSSCVSVIPSKQKWNDMIKNILINILRFITKNLTHDNRLQILMFKNISQVISENNNVQTAGGPSTTRISRPISSSVAMPLNRVKMTPHTLSTSSIRTPITTSNIGNNSRYTSLAANTQVDFIQAYNTSVNNVSQNTLRYKFNTNLNDMRVQDEISLIQENDLKTEIQDRVQNLYNIYELLITKLPNSNTQINKSLTIEELLEISMSNDDLEMINGLSQSGGGNSTYSDMITTLYTLDVKTAKYEQMIAYKTYNLYKNTFQGQNAGGLGSTLKNIHTHFESYPLVEKMNALQSLAKSLLVYVFKRVAMKLKLPKELAELSVAKDANEYLSTLAKYIEHEYNAANIITRKYQEIVKLKKESDKEKKINEINIELIEGLIGIGTIITIFRDSSFNPSDEMYESVDFLLSNLKRLKDTLTTADKKSFKQIWDNTIEDFRKSINPHFSNAKELSQHKQQSIAIKNIQDTIRIIEGNRQAMGKEQNDIARLTYEKTYLKNLSSDSLSSQWKVLEELEHQNVSNVIDISQDILFKAAISFTANHLTDEQLKQLTDASTKVVDNVIKTGFVKSTIDGFKNGFSQFLQSVPWIDSVIHILKLLAPYATTIGNIAAYTSSLGFILVVINLCIVALHYLIRLNVFFWSKYAKKNNFKVDEFLSELKKKTDIKQRGGRKGKSMLKKQKSKASKCTMKGAGFLPSIVHPKSSIQKVYDEVSKQPSSLPSINGVKLPLISKFPPISNNSSATDNDNSKVDDIETVNKIAQTFVYDISKYSTATQRDFGLTKDDVLNMAAALQELISTETVDIDTIYGMKEGQDGGKSTRAMKRLHKKINVLRSQTKQELFTFAKAKGFKVRSTDKKDDIIKAIIQKKK